MHETWKTPRDNLSQYPKVCIHDYILWGLTWKTLCSYSTWRCFCDK